MGGCLKGCLVALITVPLGFTVINTTIVLFTPVRMWETTGPVQVVTNGRETWVFFEFSTWKHRPGLLVSAPNIVVGHRQGAVVLNDDGAREYRLKDGDGPSFHPILAYIFHHGGQFFLYKSPSLGKEPSLSRWTGGENSRFERLDDADMQRILRDEGLEGEDTISLKYEDAPRTHDGWTRVAATNERWPYAEPLRFGNHVLSIEQDGFTLTLPQPPYKLVLK